MPDNDSLKQRIHAGEVVVGVSAPLDSDRSRLEGILSKDTYSFLTLDSQHSPYNEEKLVAFCSTAQDLGMPVQFRIKNTRHAYLIGNVLDLGPMAIEVPLVQYEAVVDEALDAFYYPQVGHRSWGGPARRRRTGRQTGIRPVVERARGSMPTNGNPRRDNECPGAGQTRG